MKKRIAISGWIPGLRKIQLNSMLRQHAGLSLGDAKRLVDSVLEGKQAIIEIEGDFASQFLIEAMKIGAICNDVD